MIGGDQRSDFDEIPQDYNTKGNPDIRHTNRSQDLTQLQQSHTVGKGETLFSISRKYNVSVAQIKSWNGLVNNIIHRGDNLLVSAPPSAAQRNVEPTPESYELNSRGANRSVNNFQPQDTYQEQSNTPVYHTVRAGETVASIALNYGFTEAKLRSMNKLSRNQYIKIGQKLVVSDCNCPSPTNYQESVPQEYGQAQRSVIIGGNRNQGQQPSTRRNSQVITNSQPVEKDEQFRAPDPRNTPVFYNKPQQGDYNYNNNNPAPDRPVSYESRTPVPESYNTRGTGKKKIHTVREGENLYRIAKLYGMTD